MLSIVHTIASLSRSKGGTSRSVSMLCEHMARAGARIRLVTGGLREDDDVRPDVLPALLEIKRVPAIRLPGSNVEYAPGFHRELARIVATSRPDCLQDHGIWLPSNHSAAMISRRFGIPRVLSLHGMLMPSARSRARLKKAIAWGLYQRRDITSAALLRATSEEEYRFIRALGISTPVAIVPNGIAMPSATADFAARDNMGRKTAVFVGRIHPIKGLSKLVSAWQSVRSPAWRLVIAGPSERGHRESLEEQVAAAGLAGEVEFAGPVADSEKWNLLLRSHLFILPSESENFGIAMVEALAAGLPAVASRGTPWSALPRHSCGWWVDNDPRSLSNALHEAMSLPDEELRQMGLRGATFAQREYSIAKIAKDMLLAYEWLLGGGAPRVPVYF